MATIEDLHKFIGDKWRKYCAADPIRLAPYRIRVPFTDWEARFFMCGLELGFFDVTDSDGIIVYGRLGCETKTPRAALFGSMGDSLQRPLTQKLPNPNPKEIDMKVSMGEGSYTQ